jgi:Fe-S-cluster containining protein
LTDEARTISRSLSKPVDTFATKLEGREPYAYEMRKKGNEGKCVHLEASHCGIYELRPLVCRFYPFELLTIQDGEHVFLCTNECPGIGRGKQLDKNHFKTLFQLATDQLKTKKERNCRARVFLNSRAAQRGSSQGKTETNMASRDPI